VTVDQVRTLFVKLITETVPSKPIISFSHQLNLEHETNLFIIFYLANFHFALVGHLLKGFRHPTPTTVSRTARVLTSLLTIVVKPTKRDKFEVTPDSVAYLAGEQNL
jgi:hypothetical protein